MNVSLHLSVLWFVSLFNSQRNLNETELKLSRAGLLALNRSQTARYMSRQKRKFSSPAIFPWITRNVWNPHELLIKAIGGFSVLGFILSVLTGVVFEIFSEVPKFIVYGAPCFCALAVLIFSFEKALETFSHIARWKSQQLNIDLARGVIVPDDVSLKLERARALFPNGEFTIHTLWRGVEMVDPVIEVSHNGETATVAFWDEEP